MSRVIITPRAQADIQEIYRRIRADAPLAAKKWAEGIRNEIRTLSRHPERCPLAPECSTFDAPIRELFYGRGNRGTYRILYVIQPAAVYVIHVRHGSRDTARPQDD